MWYDAVMHEKSPYMMFALIGSLVMMMTASFIFHMPQNGIESGVMSNFFAMNLQWKNMWGEINNTTPTNNPDLNRELRR